jgi:hypothetical protein
VLARPCDQCILFTWAQRAVPLRLLSQHDCDVVSIALGGESGALARHLEFRGYLCASGPKVSKFHFDLFG